MDLLKINEALDIFLLRGESARMAASNNASQIGHPCARFLVYRRHPDHWDKAQPHDLGTLYRFRDGHDQERNIIRFLQDSGFDVYEQQKAVYYPDFQVAGLIDCKIRTNGDRAVSEIKVVPDHLFGKINSGTDFLDFPDAQYYYRNYYHQLNWYQLMEGMEQGLFVLKNRQNGRLKIIGMELDFNRADEISQKLIKVNQHLAAKTLPDFQPNPDVCLHCHYFAHCAPPLDFSGEFTPCETLPPDLYDLLKRYRELKPLAAEYEDIDDNLKTILKGVKTIMGEFVITGRWQKGKTSFIIPDDLKPKLEKKNGDDFWVKNIAWPNDNT